jgi:hypothetical protein
MTLTFGAGLPILIPIALVSLSVIYLLERILLAYHYRQPELTDHSLSGTAINLLLLGPLLYLSVGFWMYNNIQIFNNDVQYTAHFDDHYVTGHSLSSALLPPKLSQALPLLLAFAFFALIVTTHPLWMHKARRLLKVEDLSEEKVEKVNFYKSLTKLQREAIIREEEAMREVMGTGKISERTMQRLKSCVSYSEMGQGRETEIIGIPTYDILDNPKFQDKFQFLPEAFENRESFHPDSEEEFDMD